MTVMTGARDERAAHRSLGAIDEDNLFATGLTAMGLPRAEIPLALLLFNVGVELGQLGFVVLVLLLERSFRLLEIRWPAMVARLPGYAVGTLGAYWTFQRVVVLLGGARA